MTARALLLLAAAAALAAGVARAQVDEGAALPPTAVQFPRLHVEPPPAAPGLPRMVNRMVASPLRLPQGHDLCVVQQVEARAAAPEGSETGGSFVEAAARNDPSTTTATTTTVDVSTPRGVMDHVCQFAGTEKVLERDGAVTADLVRAENIEFRRVAQHFFSDIDPRADYAVLGTPGGDMGEMLIAIAAVEQASGTKFRLEAVSVLLQDYWKMMASRGRKYFYMGTDESAMEALGKAARSDDPTRPRNAKERNRLVLASAEPAHVGCRHLRGMLERPAEYGVRRELVEWAIKTFWSVYYDGRNPLRQHLLLVTLKGELKPAAGVARVWSPDACPGVAPLLVPHTASSEAVVLHEAHVKFFRLDLARFFSFRNAELDVKHLYAAQNALAARQAKHLAEYYTGGVTDIIFSSYFDRYPF